MRTYRRKRRWASNFPGNRPCAWPNPSPSVTRNRAIFSDSASLFPAPVCPGPRRTALMFTRRRFLLTLPAPAPLPRVVLQPAQAQPLSTPFRKQPPAPPPPTFVYFGTDTDKGVAKGIYLSHFDVATGHLTPPSLVAETLRPSYLALSPSAPGVPRRLYAVNAVADPSATVTTSELQSPC